MPNFHAAITGDPHTLRRSDLSAGRPTLAMRAISFSLWSVAPSWRSGRTIYHLVCRAGAAIGTPTSTPPSPLRGACCSSHSRSWSERVVVIFTGASGRCLVSSRPSWRGNHRGAGNSHGRTGERSDSEVAGHGIRPWTSRVGVRNHSDEL